MFDAYHRYAHNTSVTLNQQPNDAADAARLYGELEKKAQDNIVSAIARPLTGINAEFAEVETYYAPYERERHVRIIFKLNGQPVETRVKFDDYQIERNKRDPAIYKAIAEAVTDSVMNRISMQTYVALNGGMK
jgi:hypothetical protein